MQQPSCVQTIKFETAEQLLDALSLRGKPLGPSAERGEWIFRGHANADWRLVPTALRNGVSLRDWSPHERSRWRVLNPAEHSNSELAQYERATLRAFFDRADTSGLPLPEDTQKLRRGLRDGDYDALEATTRTYSYSGSNRKEGRLPYWPSGPILSLCALAQHHGIPTRLLDWSYNPLVSAYFAATGALQPDRKDASSTELTIWALGKTLLLEIASLFQPSIEGREQSGPVQFVSASGFGNRNLHAQKGLFTTVPVPLFAKEGEVDTNLVDTSPLDVFLDGWLKKGIEQLRKKGHEKQETMRHKGLRDKLIDGDLPALLLKFRLPCDQAGMLLRLLHSEGVDASTVFPGYDGVFKALREEQSLWDKSPAGRSE